MRGPSMLLKPGVGPDVLSPPNCSSIAARGSSRVTCMFKDDHVAWCHMLLQLAKLTTKVNTSSSSAP
jgi:hypothetical protein